MNDWKYGWRLCRKSPGFTCAAAGLLAIGIGAGTFLFNALDAVILRPLPVRHPEQLVRVVQRLPMIGTSSRFPLSLYQSLRAGTTTLAAVFAEVPVDVVMDRPQPAVKLRAHMVTPEYFDALGVKALYGRTLDSRDAAPSAEPAAVLSYRFWQQRFDADRSAIGKTVTLHGHRFTIVGVMPREFNGTTVDTTPELRVPIETQRLLDDEAERGGYGLDLAARLKPGVTRRQALAEIRGLWKTNVEEEYASSQSVVQQELATGIDLDPLEHGVSVLRDRFGTPLKVLAASVALLLLLVCANLAGLLLARSAARQEEIAVRLAVGATRTRLIRQLLIESSMIAAIGAIAGLAVAVLAAPLAAYAFPTVRDIATARLSFSADFTPDLRVAGVSIAACVVVTLLFGLAPALTASLTSVQSVLRGTRAAAGWRGRRPLVVVQIALCTLLLAGACLFLRTFQRLRGTTLGFSPDHVLTFTLNPTLSGYDYARAGTMLQRLDDRVRQLPGVQATAFAARGLMRGRGLGNRVARVGETTADYLNVSTHQVSRDYFRTMGIQLLKGAAFSGNETRPQTPDKVVVNEAFEKRFFPGANAVGQFFGTPRPGRDPAKPQYKILGVVADAKYRSLREPAPPTYYTLLTPATGVYGEIVLHVRTDGAPESLIQPVRNALAALDPTIPFIEIETLASEVAASAAPERITALLAALFALFAGLVAAVGIYALLAHEVARRHREVGIRMALGAKPAAAAGLLARQALLMVACGIVAGLAAAWFAGPAVSSLLYEIQPDDPLSLAAAAGSVALIAALATAIPVAQAASIDPAKALRCD